MIELNIAKPSTLIAEIVRLTARVLELEQAARDARICVRVLAEHQPSILLSEAEAVLAKVLQ